MTVEYLSATSAVILSLCFSYIPGLKQQYEALDGIYKRLVMLVLLGVVAGGALVLACTPYGAQFQIGVTCDQVGLAEVFKVFLAAMVANQATYAITPK